MPELIEVEAYRTAAAGVVGRRVRTVYAPDAWFVKKGADPDALALALTGATVTGARRHGKLLLLDTDRFAVVGLHFGMTGRLVVDGAYAIRKLEYAGARDDPAWHRFALGFARGGSLVVSDPRRLGGVELDPDTSRLGPDAATVSVAQLRAALGGTTVALKARLLDQARLAGVGNLIADEALWRAGLDPARPAGALGRGEVARLHRSLRAAVAELTERGGSHTGDLFAHRRPGGRCPADGAALVRRAVGGRTTWSCPAHQR